jgi:hypothetical protein
MTGRPQHTPIRLMSNHTKDVAMLSRSVRLPALLVTALLALLALAGSAMAATSRVEVGAFGPGGTSGSSFTGPSQLALDQPTHRLYAYDAGASTVNGFNVSTAGTYTPLAGAFPIAVPAGGGVPDLAVDVSGTASAGNLYFLSEASGLYGFTPAGAPRAGSFPVSGFGDPCGAAVDPSGHVWVGDYGAHAVKEFTAAGTPGGSVDTSAQGSPCHVAFDGNGDLYVAMFVGATWRYTAASGYTSASLVDDGPTQALTVDRATHQVYVARADRVRVFDAAGTVLYSFATGLAGGSISGVAVDQATDRVFVSDYPNNTIRVFGPPVPIAGATTAAATDATLFTATLNGSANAGGLTVTDCHFEYGLDTSYGQTAPCVPAAASIPADTAEHAVTAAISGLAAHRTYHVRLVVANANGSIAGEDQTFVTLASATTDAASGATLSGARLHGTVRPGSLAVDDCHFDYGVDTSYGQSAPCVPAAASIPADDDPHAVAADVTGLASNTTYHFRLAVTNANGSDAGDDQTVTTLGAGIVDSGTTAVGTDRATVTARINPNSEDTTFHIEYGTDTGYGHATPESASIGSDTSDHAVSVALTGLAAETTYHWRVVAVNASGTVTGPDRTFTTTAGNAVGGSEPCNNQALRTGPSAALKDCRAYEMVSPVDKNNGDIKGLCDPVCTRAQLQQAAVSGDKITYSSYKSFGDQLSAPYASQYLATRTAGGWMTHGLNPPRDTTVYGDGIRQAFDLAGQFSAFSADLSSAWLINDNAKPLTADAVQGIPNVYRRDNGADRYEALTNADMHSPSILDFPGGMMLQGHSADGRHAVFSAKGRFTPDAAATLGPQLYDFSGGTLRLVSILADGTALASGGASVGVDNPTLWDDNRRTTLDHAISDDGSRVFWTAFPDPGFPGPGRLEVRIDGERTVEVSPDTVYFRAASADGAKVIYSTNYGGSGSGSLYEFDVDAGTTRHIADGALGVLGASDDLSSIYFVSTDVMASGGRAGENNLYLERDGVVSLVTTLSSLDRRDVAQTPLERASRVTPDGRHIAFESTRSLTGYDNVDAVDGQDDIEVFTYDADADRLACVSCNPSGARPVGQPLLLPYSADGSTTYGAGRGGAAAWLTTAESGMYEPRSLTGDGSRLFFNSFDALVPADTNGKQDVYEWVAQGTGGCARADGCVRLISSGTSPQISELVDSAADGRDVFFTTSSSLVPQDDGHIDIYDARVGGGFAPPAPTPGACTGELCQGPAAVPAAAPVAASITFAGPSNSRPGAATPAKVKVTSRTVSATSVTLRVKVAGKGVLTGSGATLQTLRKRVIKAGTYTVTLRLTAAARRSLKRHRTLKVRARVSFAPSRGAASQATVALTLREPKQAHRTRAATKNSGGAK